MELFDEKKHEIWAALDEVKVQEEDPALVSYEQDKNGAPSASMRNFQRSLSLLSEEERHTLLNQHITPSTAETSSIQQSKTSALDISEITEVSTVSRYFMPELAMPFIPFELPVYPNQVSAAFIYFKGYDQRSSRVLFSYIESRGVTFHLNTLMAFHFKHHCIIVYSLGFWSIHWKHWSLLLQQWIFLQWNLI